MRMIHEIEQPMQCSGSCRGGYAIPTVEREAGRVESSGFRVDLLACNDPNFKEYLTDCEESLHLEGNAAYVRAMLVDLIETIDCCAEILLEKGELVADWKEIKRPLVEEGKGR